MNRGDRLVKGGQLRESGQFIGARVKIERFQCIKLMSRVFFPSQRCSSVLCAYIYETSRYNSAFCRSSVIIIFHVETACHPNEALFKSNNSYEAAASVLGVLYVFTM